MTRALYNALWREHSMEWARGPGPEPRAQALSPGPTGLGLHIGIEAGWGVVGSRGEGMGSKSNQLFFWQLGQK